MLPLSPAFLPLCCGLISPRFLRRGQHTFPTTIAQTGDPMTKPDPDLMQQSRDYYAHAAACDAAGLKDEAKAAQAEGTRCWMLALGRSTEERR